MGAGTSKPPAKPNTKPRRKHRAHPKPGKSTNSDHPKPKQSPVAEEAPPSLEILSQDAANPPTPPTTEPEDLLDLTIAILREKREQGLWCVTDHQGKYCLRLLRGENKWNVRCSFVERKDIRYMVSYRWRDYATVAESEAEIAINFLNATKTRNLCWVDSLNHLNNYNLKLSALNEMGELYRTRETVAEYFLHKPTSVRALFQMLLDATRCWMWQEMAANLCLRTVLALTGRNKFGGNAAQLCLALIHLGRDCWGELYWAVRKKVDRKHAMAAVPFAVGRSEAYLVDKKNHDQVWPSVVAMITALQLCFMHAARLEEHMEEWGEDAWATYRGEAGLTLPRAADAFCVEDFSVLLGDGVPKRAIELVMELAQMREPEERMLLSAAANLQNANIGCSAQWYKWDLLHASLAVVAHVPAIVGSDAADKTFDERLPILLPKIKRALLGNVKSGSWNAMLDHLRAARDIDGGTMHLWSGARTRFQPVPCGSRQIGDLFGFGLVAILFSKPLRYVQMRSSTGELQAERYPVVSVTDLRSGANKGEESLLGEQERPVESTWVELREADGEDCVLVFVTAFITTCGLKVSLKPDWGVTRGGPEGGRELREWQPSDRPANAPWMTVSRSTLDSNRHGAKPHNKHHNRRSRPPPHVGL